MPGRRVIPVLLATLAVTLATGLPTHAAAGDASITHVEPRRGALNLLVSVPAGALVDLSDVEVTIDGVPAKVTAQRAGTDDTVERISVLAIDTSDSMRGARFSAAKEAAHTYLASLPPDVAVGIVSFSDRVVPELAPTTDRAQAGEVVDALTLSRQTLLYDGVLGAIDMAGREGQRTVLVLSDGADTSDTELEDVAGAVEDAGVLLDVVALEQRGQARTALEELASAGNGRVIDADPEALTQAFSEEAGVLARQLLVTAKLPDSVQANEAAVVVSLPTVSDTLTAEAFVPLRAGKPDKSTPPNVSAESPGLVLERSWLWGGLAALALGLVAVVVLLAPRPRTLSPAERAASYTERLGGGSSSDSAHAPRFEPDQALEQAKDAARKVLARNRSLEARIAHRLEGAGNPLKPAEWLLLHTAIIVAAGLLGLLLGAGSPVLLILFLLLGGFGPYLWLKFKRSRRRKAFEGALPETLQLMSGSLAAGLSLAQSVDTIVREGVEPVASEFRRVLVETRLGIPLEDALDSAAERFESKDFAWAVMAIRIQRQVGGNLAELLDTVAATMREREYMRRQVAALAAEGKLSAWVLGGLPPAFMLYLLATNRDYVIVMFTDPIGWLMLGGAGLLLGLGVFWMSRLIKVEV